MVHLICCGGTVHSSLMPFLAYILMSSYLQEMSNARSAAKSSQSACKKMKNASTGYRPVTVTWMDLDKCNVCHMDEVLFFFRKGRTPNSSFNRLFYFQIAETY